MSFKVPSNSNHSMILQFLDPKTIPRNTVITHTTSKIAREKFLLAKGNFHLLSIKLTQLASKEGRT